MNKRTNVQMYRWTNEQWTNKKKKKKTRQETKLLKKKGKRKQIQTNYTHSLQTKTHKRTYLREGFLLQHQLVERRRVLAHAVPRAGCVADQILRRGDPCFALSRHSLHAVDAYFTIFAVENVLEQILILRARVQLVEKRRRHHRGRLFIAIESKFGAGRVARADVGIHRVADSRHVWALRQIYIYKLQR